MLIATTTTTTTTKKENLFKYMEKNDYVLNHELLFALHNQRNVKFIQKPNKISIF